MASRFFAGARYALIALAALSATNLRADWLVLRDGSRVETRGAWETRGATLVFHRPDGTLASLRTSEVDLAASTAATVKAFEAARRAREAPAPPPPPKKAPIIVLTDEDFTRVTSPEQPAQTATSATAETGAAQAAAAGSSGEATAKAERLEIITWRRDHQDPGADLSLIGEVRNTSSVVTANIQVTVKLLDGDGGLLATSDALTGTSVLQPGQHTNFRATFPGMSGYANVAFETRHFALSSPSESSGSGTDPEPSATPAPRHIEPPG